MLYGRGGGLQGGGPSPQGGEGYHVAGVGVAGVPGFAAHPASTIAGRSVVDLPRTSGAISRVLAVPFLVRVSIVMHDAQC